MPTILIVDDRPINLKYLRAVLGGAGARLLEAGDGASALAIARDERPDLVITDLIMPVMDGLELARRIREEPEISRTPIIVFTAIDGQDAARMLAEQCGVASVIIKPAEPEEILDAVTAALGAESGLALRPLPAEFDRDHLRLLSDELSHQVVALEAANRRLRTVHEITRGILRADSAETIAAAAIRSLDDLAQPRRISIAVIDFERGEIRELACRLAGAPAIPLRAPLGALGAAMVAGPGDGRAVDFDIAPFAGDSKVGAELLAQGARYFHVQLMAVHGRTIGCVAVASSAPLDLSKELCGTVREVADDMAVALYQARLHTELERHAADLERRVEERTSELRDTNAELEKFCYSISHDLRNPLSGILGFGTMLVQDEGDQMSEKSRRRLGHIVTSARQMDELIVALLRYASATREELVLAPIDLEELLRRALYELEAVLDARAAVVTVDSPLPRVIGHGVAVGRALSNLIANGTKFVASGSAPRVGVRGERRGDVVRIWIEDNGIGIAPEHQEKIFGVLTRLHSSDAYPGTGIGLAIVKRAIERSGGRVGVESEPGRGSRFWIELPSADGAPPAVS